MKRWGGKKAYFFIIDAVIGSTILFFSLYLLLSGDIRQDTLQIDYEASEDYASFLINTQIQDLNNEYMNNLTQEGIITNIRNTVIEQINQFYYDALYVCSGDPCRANNLTYANKIIQNLTDLLITQKYGMSYTIIDSSNGINTTIYSRDISSLSTSNIVISSRKVTFLYINSTVFFGPELVEIKLWIK
jgi:hypothetical protein